VSDPAGQGGPVIRASSSRLEARLGATALASLYSVGGFFVLLMALLAEDARTSEAGLIAVAAMAFAIGFVLFRLSDRFQLGALAYLLAWGTTLVTAVAYFSGVAPSPLVFFYLWVFLYSAYFFSRAVVVAQIAYVGVNFGLLMILRAPPGGGISWWLIGMGILLVAAALVWTMRRRSEQLIERLYAAARTDPLTGLTNRLGFREQLDLELERSRRSGASLSIAAGDLDGFKRVNDRHGHHSGDEALKLVAETLGRGKRVIDTVARTGGEEFTLILPDTTAEGAFTAAERLREMVSVAFAESEAPVTISFGIAQFPDQGETAASLLRAADEALYCAKEEGRNRTVRRGDAGATLARRSRASASIGAERYIGLMLELAEAADLRFSGSARHSETVGRYAEMMAKELGLSEQRVSQVRLAGLLHDIGKIAIPAAILDKPGVLTDGEYEIAKRHPELGAELLSHPALSEVRGWVATHHERPDGRGYPFGLAGQAIAIEARIVAVADAYEAMTSDRVYRSSIGHAAAREELERHSGTQFDRRVVEAFITVLDRDFPLTRLARRSLASPRT
jgi:diguanylate cyclase (GGDEF)-like protein/putative nucleotidyltransferase with HDIG domain